MAEQYAWNWVGTYLSSLPLALFVATLSLAVSSASFFFSRDLYRLQWVNTLHSKLFGSWDDYEILYWIDKPSHPFYFNGFERGQEGNFVGSELEKKTDFFLERMNFVCMSLLTFRSVGDSELLFEEYIRRVYTTRFFQEYFSFLSHEHFKFIHEYAHVKLGFERPAVSYPGKRARPVDLEEDVTDPS
jgi:hypothetical protein